MRNISFALHGRLSRAAALTLAIAVSGGPARATTTLTTTLVASGFSLPVFVTAPPGDTARLFVVEQRGADARGRIKIVKGGVVLPAPFLTTPLVATGSEQGLLGLAFAPDYATSRRFYVHYTDAAGTTTLARYLASASDPDVATATPDAVVFTVAQPYTNHNGGWIAFGPDGYLYLALGDGGLGGDPGDRAQDIGVPLGKILRFDVSGAGAVAAPGNPFYGAIPGLDTIWSFGLRNPWRDSFDRATGDLVIGDVGQNAWEEIDFAPANAGWGAGWNFGWRCYEGNVAYTTSTTTPCGSCTAPGCDLKFPAWVYPHTLGRCSISGGYVYRGCRIPDLQGTYFFADYCGNQIYTGKFVNGVLSGVMDRSVELDPPGAASITSVSSFGEDAAGELYLCDLNGGEVFQVVPRTGVAEADMPVLRVPTALGDTLGATTPGNALTPGIVPFADLGSRIRGAGYLRDAAPRACAERSGNCQSTSVRLAMFDLDITACVDPDSAILTRTFVFHNTAATAQPLAYVDVIAPYLNHDADLARAVEVPTATSTAGLVLDDARNPSRYLRHRGYATGAAFSMDVDSASAIVARVGADLPLGNHPAAGPAHTALALGFDFGSLAAGGTASLAIVTRLQTTPPVGVVTSGGPGTGLALRIVGPMPFRESLQLVADLPHAGPLRIDVFDVRGRRVRTLLDAQSAAGAHPLQWDGRDENGRTLGAGLYFVRLHTSGAERAVRVVRVQ